MPSHGEGASGGENSADENSAKNSADEHSDASSDGNFVVPPPPSPPGVHTRLQKGIRHPKKYTDGRIRYGLLSSTGEPYTLTEALNDPNWHQAMEEEHNALLDNKTWHLVPPSTTRT
jgi:hypothetical protein